MGPSQQGVVFFGIVTIWQSRKTANEQKKATVSVQIAIHKIHKLNLTGALRRQNVRQPPIHKFHYVQCKNHIPSIAPQIYFHSRWKLYCKNRLIGIKCLLFNLIWFGLYYTVSLPLDAIWNIESTIVFEKKTSPNKILIWFLMGSPDNTRMKSMVLLLSHFQIGPCTSNHSLTLAFWCSPQVSKVHIRTYTINIMDIVLKSLRVVGLVPIWDRPHHIHHAQPAEPVLHLVVLSCASFEKPTFYLKNFVQAILFSWQLIKKFSYSVYYGRTPVQRPFLRPDSARSTRLLHMLYCNWGAGWGWRLGWIMASFRFERLTWKIIIILYGYFDMEICMQCS